MAGSISGKKLALEHLGTVGKLSKEFLVSLSSKVKLGAILLNGKLAVVIYPASDSISVICVYRLINYSERHRTRKLLIVRKILILTESSCIVIPRKVRTYCRNLTSDSGKLVQF